MRNFEYGWIGSEVQGITARVVEALLHGTPAGELGAAPTPLFPRPLQLSVDAPAGSADVAAWVADVMESACAVSYYPSGLGHSSLIWLCAEPAFFPRIARVDSCYCSLNQAIPFSSQVLRISPLVLAEVVAENAPARGDAAASAEARRRMPHGAWWHEIERDLSRGLAARERTVADWLLDVPAFQG